MSNFKSAHISIDAAFAFYGESVPIDDANELHKLVNGAIKIWCKERGYSDPAELFVTVECEDTKS